MPGTIKFKYEFSHEKIEFLDLEIYLQDGKLRTNLYVKPTNKQLYLDFNSNHPKHCKESIPYSQALRIVERCATHEDTSHHLSQLKSKLEERNYPSELIEDKFEKAKKKDRRSLIFQQRKERKKSDDKVRLIMTHSQANPPIHKWLRESKHLLARNDEAKALGNKIQIGSKQPKNLQRIAGGQKNVAGAVPNPAQDPGCKKCGRCKVSCPILEEGRNFNSTNTGKRYRIRQNLTCDSDWVIYLVTCKRCKGQYVGKSKTVFKKRHSNHKCEIRNKIGGLGHHYGGSNPCGYEDLSITLIEQVEVKTMDFLAERELFWQHQIRAYVQNGSNAHCYRKDLKL